MKAGKHTENNNIRESIQILAFEKLKLPGLIHFISCRTGGTSPHPYHSMNLGYQTGDSASNVSLNRQLLADFLGIPLQQWIFCRQIHGSDIVTVSHSQIHSKSSREYTQLLPVADGLISEHKNLCLCILTADCAPVLLYDPERRVCAALHAGRRSITAGIIENCMSRLKTYWGSQSRSIFAGIGPSIEACCYLVDQLSFERYIQSSPAARQITNYKDNGSFRLDLASDIYSRLIVSGIPGKQIEIMKICTSCHDDMFYSY
ncbi:laccase domain-containing protein, partial [bacterium]|nr:laccase domain-containing protein [candidate division CSSED10-310 bacterium]